MTISHADDLPNGAAKNETAPEFRVWVIDGHPLAGSFGAALARAYADGAHEAGHAVRITILRELAFEFNDPHAPLETDLVQAQQDLKWCTHLMAVYPNWWGTYPAMLKAFLDRCLTSGFAFRITASGWNGLLEGRSAQLITTLDTPVGIYRFVLGAPGTRAMRHATLGFCGIKPVAIKYVGPIHDSTPKRRQQWLAEIQQMGRQVERDFFSGPRARLRAWASVARLQFYPFPLLALLTGALAARTVTGNPLRLQPLFLMGACAVLVEFITVLTNEIHDQDTDQMNGNAGPFTGGSRVLVNRQLTEAQMRRGRLVAMIGLTGALSGLTWISNQEMAWPGVVLVLTGLLLGHQYSAPPLRLSRRGLGELDVAFTHSLLVVAMGWFSQTKQWGTYVPWAFAFVMGISVLPSILLAALPDAIADASVGKKTVAVRLGTHTTLRLAMAATLAAVAGKILTDSGGPWSFPLTSLAVAHGIILTNALWKFDHRRPAGRIDGLLVLALSFMLWFALEPLLALVSLKISAS